MRERGERMFGEDGVEKQYNTERAQ